MSSRENKTASASSDAGHDRALERASGDGKLPHSAQPSTGQADGASDGGLHLQNAHFGALGVKAPAAATEGTTGTPAPAPATAVQDFSDQAVAFAGKHRGDGNETIGTADDSGASGFGDTSSAPNGGTVIANETFSLGDLQLSASRSAAPQPKATMQAAAFAQDENEAPTDIALSNTTVSENAAGAVVGVLSTVDPDAGDHHTYTLSDDRFEVVEGQLKLKDGVWLDHEGEPSLTITVTSTDSAGHSITETFTITVANVNEGPSDIVLSNSTIAENAAGTVVGQLSTFDPDAGEGHTYHVSDDRFEVIGGQLKLKDGIALDHEGEPSVTLDVTTTDAGGLSRTESFTITVANVNEAPSDIALSNATVLENTAGAVIGTLSTADPDTGDSHTYSVSDSRFEVIGGQLKLKDGVALDHEGEPSVTVHVTTTDSGGLSLSESFTVTVENVNEGPSDVALSNASVAENAAGAVVGTLSTVDPDAGDSHTYTVSDTRFEIVDGQLKLKDGIALDHESEPSVTVQVTATDAGGLSLSEDFTITVENVNEGPSDISLSNATVVENAAGAVVGTLSSTDPDAGDAHTYAVSDSRFEVVSGQLKLKGGVTLDHESEPSVTLQVTTTDAGGLSYSENFAVIVENANEAPSDMALSNATVAENAAGAVIGTLSAVDADAGDSHTYSVSDDRFEVVGGQLKLKDGVALDRESEASVSVDVTATDTGGASLTESFTITVENVNEAPSAIDLSNTTVAENLAGAAVDTLSTADPDAGDTHVYTVSDTRFEVVGGLLKLKSGVRLDHEALSGNTINLTVTSTDASGQAVAQDFIIQIENFDDTAATKTLGTTGADVFFGTDKADAFDGVGGNDNLSGGASNDLLWGGAGDDTLSGGGGNDSLYGGNNNDNLSGGDDNDLVDGGSGNDTLAGGAGDDTLIGGDGSDIMAGGAGTDTLSGGNGNDTLRGDEGDDALDGGAGNDTLEGGAGDDTLTGAAGNDTLRGGEGSDTYRVGAGAGSDAYVDGGSSGVDTVVATANNVVINLQSGFGTASGIDAISANGFGGVSIQGGSGSDTFDFSTMTLTGITKIDGGAGNDTITGSAGDDRIVGAAGNDALRGGGGSDTYQIGSGHGLDTFSDTGASGVDRVVATAAGVAIGIQSGFGPASGIEEIDSGGFANVSVVGGTGNDTLNFSATTLNGIAKIDGGAGNDTITGSAGDDTIVGGAGNDTVGGGGGSDTYQIGAGAGFDRFTDTGASGVDRVVATAAGVAIGIQSGYAAASGIEEISSDGFANVSIVGGTGSDTLDFSATTLSGIAKIDGGTGNDTIMGSAGDDTIVGGAGNDTLGGGGGSDTYQVGTGAGFDRFTDTGASGVDRVLATAADVAIGLQSGFGAASGIEEISSAGFANISIVGGTGNDTLDFSATTLNGIAKIDGGAGNDAITGSAGDDTIVGGAGNDTLRGGGGSDTYQIGTGAGFDRFADTGASGVDRIVATAAGTVIGLQSGFAAASGIEEIGSGGFANVAIAGGTGNDTLDFSATTLSGISRIDGAAGNDTITGSAGADALYGGAGNDRLTGGAGDDWIVGGTGTDVLAGGAGVSDTVSYEGSATGVSVNLGTNAVSGGDAQGDTISGFENVTGSSFDDVIHGDANNNIINAGAGNDRVFSSWGLDTIDGGAGSDTVDLTNFNGMGSMTVDLAQGLVYFTGHVGGADHISNFENASGASGSDTFFGSSGDNVMAGVAGNDVFHFSLTAGHDVAQGGAGIDFIQIDTAAGSAGWLEAIAADQTPVLSDGDWLLQLDNGEAFVLHGSGGTFDFGATHAGVLTAVDGSEMQFTEIEGVRW